MQFHRIAKPEHSKKPLPNINYSSICKCCNSREVGGYIGNGTVLSDICIKCYRRFSEGKERISQITQSSNRKGRS